MDSQDIFDPKNKAKVEYPEQPEKQCEGRDCLNMFRPSGPWGGRRCERCKKEKRPYKDSDSPF